MRSHVRLLLHQIALQLLDLPLGVPLVHLSLGRRIVVYVFITVPLREISISQLPILLFDDFKTHVLADIDRVNLVVGQNHRLIRCNNLRVFADHALFNLRGGVHLLKQDDKLASKLVDLSLVNIERDWSSWSPCISACATSRVKNRIRIRHALNGSPLI